jgi:hypothetical protein
MKGTTSIGRLVPVLSPRPGRETGLDEATFDGVAKSFRFLGK